jgi:hypothetical protein
MARMNGAAACETVEDLRWTMADAPRLHGDASPVAGGLAEVEQFGE